MWRLPCQLYCGPTHSIETSAIGGAQESLDALLSHVGLDGTLRAYYQTYDSDIFHYLRTTCLVNHGIGLSYDGKCYSRWFLAGLNTYVVPSGRTHWKWQPMNGQPPGLFNKDVLGPEFPKHTPGRTVMRLCRENELEIRTPDGIVWAYKSGILVRINVPGFGVVQVECKGNLISSLRLEGEEQPEVHVQYDDELHPVAMYQFGTLVTKFNWGNGGELLGWTRVGGPTFSCTYTDNLIDTITVSTGERADITWAYNPGWQRGDSRWLAPMHISKFGDEKYSFKVDQRGFNFLIEKGVPAKLIALIYNPATELVVVNPDTSPRQIALRQ